MKTNSSIFSFTNLIAIGLAILAGVLVFAVLTGRKIPLIEGDRTALIVLFVIGFVMCSFGIGRVSATGQWAHPLSIIGYLLGALIMLFAAAGIFGFRFLFVNDPRSAIIVVAILMAAKVVLTFVHMLIK